MADADEATNELIARILAADQDQQYGYEDAGAGEASDDSDYGGPKRKKAKRGAKAAGKPAAAAKPAGERAAPRRSSEVDGELTATGRRKRKDTGAKREGAAKGWTEEEERLFLEALELHGRDWHKAAAHVGTRDNKAFTSHAQKHFIKLAIADRPLPAKVVATGQGDGLGYTLSGLPLDPHSASARSYGLKPEHLQRLLTSGGPAAKGLLLPGKENQGQAAAGSGAAAVPATNAEPEPAGPGPAAAGEAAGGQAAQAQQPQAPKQPRSRRFVVPPPLQQPQQQQQPQQAAEGPRSPQEPTEYMKNRPRREGAGMRSRWGGTSESLELVPCQEFMGPPGSGAALAQPFEVRVSGEANLVMDCHAHLAACEIIGLLGGRWQPAARRVEVAAAFPCSRVAGSHSGTSVEVDPAAQVAALTAMEQRGLTSVGWYHSHPVFAPTPSQKDSANQRNQQAMHRCGVTGLEPCVGAIVGPYDTSLPTEASAISWFVVQTRGAQLLPFRLRLAEPTPAARPSAELEACLTQLVRAAAADPDRVELTKEWRPFRLLVDGQPHGGRLSHLQKARLALARHFAGPGADAEAAAGLLDRVFAALREAWQLPPPPGQQQEAAEPVPAAAAAEQPAGAAEGTAEAQPPEADA